MLKDEAEKRKLEKLVSIKSWASCGVEPSLMGTGPIPSSKKALELADRGYVLVNGKISLEGQGKDLLNNPDVQAAYLEGGK